MSSQTLRVFLYLTLGMLVVTISPAAVSTSIFRQQSSSDEIGRVTKGSSEEIKETSASSKVLSANDVMNTKLFFHQPPLNNRNEDNISFQSRNSEPVHGTFFTKSQTHQLLKFPNDIVNPNNRLQISEEELATVTPDISLSSEEVGEFFTKGISSKNNSSIGSLLRDEIHTMNLTLSIVRQSTWGDENIVFSPLSIANVLALLRLGSSGRTLKELSSVLNIKDLYKLEDEERSRKYHESFRRLLILLKTKSGPDCALEIANQIFTDTSFSLKGTYVTESMKFYDTPVESFSFGTEGNLFQDRVNQWVLQKTSGKIKSIIDEPPSPTTTLAFINAVYFKGDWEVPFVERITRRKTFYVKSNETLDVQMMMNVLHVPFLDQDDFQIAGIPYKGNRTGFFVILPKTSGPGAHDGIEDLQRIERKLTADLLIEKIRKMRPQKVAVKIPKLKISSDGHIKEILSGLGVPSIFEPTLANFSKLSGNDGLYVSAVHHRAVIEVNEHGTEAAAVTIGTGDRTIDELPVPFNVNKPFIFFIYHVKAETVLFWGRVTRPE